MANMLKDKVVLVTGAGRGIGAEVAKLAAAEGAKVVVNDLGGSVDGEGTDSTPAQQVCDEIIAAGGEAVANYDSVADFQAAQAMVRQAVDTFGKIDGVVNVAGILRDVIFHKMTKADWDSVIAVHLKGTFAMARHACEYWREEHKKGNVLNGRIINTSSDAGLLVNDVILTWNGEEFSDPTLLSRAIAATPIGSEIPVKVLRETPRGAKEVELDVVVASIHQGFGQGEAENTKRLICAAENRFVHILGHMTGRLLLEREGYKVNAHAVIDAFTRQIHCARRQHGHFVPSRELPRQRRHDHPAAAAEEHVENVSWPQRPEPDGLGLLRGLRRPLIGTGRHTEDAGYDHRSDEDHSFHDLVLEGYLPSTANDTLMISSSLRALCAYISKSGKATTESTPQACRAASSCSLRANKLPMDMTATEYVRALTDDAR